MNKVWCPRCWKFVTYIIHAQDEYSLSIWKGKEVIYCGECGILLEVKEVK